MLGHRFLLIIKYSWNKKDFFLLVEGTVKPNNWKVRMVIKIPKKPFARTLYTKVIQDIKNVSFYRDRI